MTICSVCMHDEMLLLHAVSIVWIGLRRGWWVDLITLFLKTINKKGSPREAKSKSKKKKTGTADEEAEGDAEVGKATGDHKAAKALFEAMKAKMQGTGAERKHDAVQTCQSMLCSEHNLCLLCTLFLKHVHCCHYHVHDCTQQGTHMSQGKLPD